MGLGVVIPACLFTVGAANAATTTTTRSSELPSVCEKLDQSNDVFSRLTANAKNNPSDEISLGHADTHTDMGGNHVDSHSNFSHTDRHSDFTRGQNEQCVHTDTHTNALAISAIQTLAINNIRINTRTCPHLSTKNFWAREELKISYV